MSEKYIVQWCDVRNGKIVCFDYEPMIGKPLKFIEYKALDDCQEQLASVKADLLKSEQRALLAEKRLEKAERVMLRSLTKFEGIAEVGSKPEEECGKVQAEIEQYFTEKERSIDQYEVKDPVYESNTKFVRVGDSVEITITDKESGE